MAKAMAAHSHNLKRIKKMRFCASELSAGASGLCEAKPRPNALNPRLPYGRRGFRFDLK